MDKIRCLRTSSWVLGKTDAPNLHIFCISFTHFIDQTFKWLSETIVEAVNQQWRWSWVADSLIDLFPAVITLNLPTRTHNPPALILDLNSGILSAFFPSCVSSLVLHTFIHISSSSSSLSVFFFFFCPSFFLYKHAKPQTRAGKLDYHGNSIFQIPSSYGRLEAEQRRCHLDSTGSPITELCRPALRSILTALLIEGLIVALQTINWPRAHTTWNPLNGAV